MAAGLFFGGPRMQSSADGSFLSLDATTQGTWRGVYGADGYSIATLTPSLPSSQMTITGASLYTWNSSTTDVRALQKPAPATDRLATIWYRDSGVMTIDLTFTDGNFHNVALYMLDWDTTSRAHTITVFDPVKGVEYYNQNLSSLNAGKWLVLKLKGRVFINLTKTAGYNAVVSGVFFDPPSP